MNINQIIVKMYVYWYDNFDVLAIERFGINFRPLEYEQWLTELITEDYNNIMEMRIRDFERKTKDKY